jgi:hypothetical protein
VPRQVEGRMPGRYQEDTWKDVLPAIEESADCLRSEDCSPCFTDTSEPVPYSTEGSEKIPFRKKRLCVTSF